MLWSTSEEVRRRKDKNELTKYIAKTMSSSYEMLMRTTPMKKRERN
jgi:hypothetical protein